jgi:hypothetical protein
MLSFLSSFLSTCPLVSERLQLRERLHCEVNDMLGALAIIRAEHSALWREQSREEQRRAEQSTFNWLKRWSGGALCTLSPVAEQTRDEGRETGSAEGEEEEEGDLEARSC